MSTNE